MYVLALVLSIDPEPHRTLLISSQHLILIARRAIIAFLDDGSNPTPYLSSPTNSLYLAQIVFYIAQTLVGDSFAVNIISKKYELGLFLITRKLRHTVCMWYGEGTSSSLTRSWFCC